MKGSTKFSIIFALLLFHGAFYAHSQDNSTPPDLKFSRLSLEDGLSDTNVMVISQDHQGFMWFGTQKGGLNRYDGNEFKIYKSDSADKYSLSNDFIWSLFADSKNNLWIGTNGGGLNLYDSLSDRIIQYPLDSSGVPHANIKTIFEDSDGVLWIGGSSANGFSKLDWDTGEFFTYHTENDDGIRAICQDRETGLLWLGTYHYGVLVFDPDTEQFIHNYPFDPNNPNSISSNMIQQIIQDKTGNLWVTTPNGLNHFNRETETFTRFIHDPDDPSSLSYNRVERMYEDSIGRLWITSLKGLNLFHPDSETFTSYFHDPNNPESLSDSFSRPLFEDNTGALWVGTRNDGINMLSSVPEKFITYQKTDTPDSLSGNSINSLYTDTKGNVWIGTTDGLNYFNGKTFTRYLHNPDDPASISDNLINSIIEGPSGGVWIATNEGLSYLDGQSFTNYRHDPNNPESIGGQVVIDILPDNYGGLWLSVYGVGIDYFDGQTFTHYKAGHNNSGGLNAEWPYQIVKDSYSERIWICSLDKGILQLDPDTKTFTNIFPSPELQKNIPLNQMLTIYQEEPGLLWVGGSQSGLMLIDPETEQLIRHYTKNDGLADNNIISIIGDKHEQLWINTQNGLSRFDPQSETFRNYYASDGLQSSQLTHSTITPDGQIFTGGPKGLNAFYPDQIKDNPNIPTVVLVGFELFNQPVVIGREDSPLKQTIGTSDELVLSYDQSVFTFEFAALNYISPERNQYAYMMEGFDNEWRHTSSDRRFATYTNLDPGRYTFRVKASNNDGVWNEEGVSLPVIITPPWWETAWFRTLAAILIIGAITGVFFRQHNRSKRRELKLERKVSERTIELAGAKSEAETAREKAETANKAKSQFLSNMSHELRTPLNGILGYTQILKRRHSDDYTNSGLNVIQKSGDHLLTLINDILDISKIEAGKLELNPSEVHLSSFLKTILGIIRTRAEARDILLMYEPLSSLPSGIIIDETRLRQVLLNLMGNAVKFTNKGYVSLTIKALFQSDSTRKSNKEETEDKKTVKLRFCVEDTGVGLKPEQMKTIFQPFEQVGNMEKRAEGTGLGLPISQRIVQLMGGDLHVESPAMPKTSSSKERERHTYTTINRIDGGQGSRFWFEVTLPVTSGIEKSDTKDDKITGYQGDHRKILAVDDKDYNRLVLTNMLIPLGFNVVTANDGKEAIDKALSYKPDLIFMDLVMPVKTGFDAVKELRGIESTKDIPIIAVSASVLKESQQESLDVGCQAFLSKPIDMHKLFKLLQIHLHLEWLYSENDEKVMDKVEAIVAPPADELKILKDLVLRGDIFGINEWAAHIETLGDQYIPFVRKIHDLALNFEIQGILLLVERYLDKE